MGVVKHYASSRGTPQRLGRLQTGFAWIPLQVAPKWTIGNPRTKRHGNTPAPRGTEEPHDP